MFRFPINHQSRINSVVTLEDAPRSQHDSENTTRELFNPLQGDAWEKDELIKAIVDSVQHTRTKIEKSM